MVDWRTIKTLASGAVIGALFILTIIFILNNHAYLAAVMTFLMCYAAVSYYFSLREEKTK